MLFFENRQGRGNDSDFRSVSLLRTMSSYCRTAEGREGASPCAFWDISTAGVLRTMTR